MDRARAKAPFSPTTDLRRRWRELRARRPPGAAPLLLMLLLAGPWPGMARAVDAARWMERTSPSFHLVASQSGEEGGIPFTSSPGSLAQDQTGFIWNGTDVGLERWDGYHIRTYTARSGDPCALPADYVVTLFVDGRGRLWISTFGGGLGYYEPATDCIHRVDGGPMDLNRAPVDSFASDAAGGLWLGTTAGLAHLSPDLHQVLRLPPEASSLGHLSHERICCVLRDRHDSLWVGSDAGLERRAAGQDRFASVDLPAGAKVRTLLESADGRIWVGTASDGAFVIDSSTARVKAIEDIRRLDPLPLIWRAAQTPGGEIWLGTTSTGIIRVDPVSLRVRPLRHQKGVATSLPEDAVVDLMRDRSGLLWVASDSGFGFFNLRDDVATILSDDELNAVGEGLVKAIVPMQGERIAIAVGTKIAQLAPVGTGAAPVSFAPLPPPGSIATLATLNGRDLFAATQPYALVWLDRSTHRSHSVLLPGPGTSRRILALLADGERLWVGGTEGLWLVERGGGDRGASGPWMASRQFALRDVWAIAPGSGDTRWVGTVKGLYRVTRSRDQPVHVQLSNPAGEVVADPHIKSLHTDRQGHLWIGTNSDGLFIVDPTAGAADRAPVLRHLIGELPSGAISAMLEDSHGAVWVSTDRGISRIDARSFTVSRLTRGDGITIPSYVSGGCADPACSELMFGGRNGITLIRPDRAALARAAPAVVFTRITIGRTEVPSSRFNTPGRDEVLELPPQIHGLTVEFAALDYADPMHSRYEYRLDGYDHDWMPTGAEARLASYMNLAPGWYRLRVRASDHGNSGSPREADFQVHVPADWYQTLWFRSLLVIGVLLTLILIVQWRTMVLRSRQRALELLVEVRTQALVRATGERNSLIENLAHDLRTPLTSLRGYLDRLNLKDDAMTEADRARFIGIAVHQVERLIRLVRELFELVRLDDPFARLNLEQFSPAEIVQDVVQEFAIIAEGRRIDCELERGVEFTRIVGDISLFQRMMENLVVNAVSHTPPGGRIAVRLRSEAAAVVLDVSDTGRGIEPADIDRIFNRYERGDTKGRLFGAGLGLAIVKRILDLHGGSIVVDSEVGRGTRFTIRWPREGRAPPPGGVLRGGGRPLLSPPPPRPQ